MAPAMAGETAQALLLKATLESIPHGFLRLEQLV
jgi:hypothetical protein